MPDAATQHSGVLGIARKRRFVRIAGLGDELEYRNVNRAQSLCRLILTERSGIPKIKGTLSMSEQRQFVHVRAELLFDCIRELLSRPERFHAGQGEQE